MLSVKWKHARAISPLCLGTAQLGMRYGIANQTGMPDDVQAAALLTAARDSGITVLDTARAYGESEQRIGAFRNSAAFITVTKLDPLASLAQAGEAGATALVDSSIDASRRALQADTLPYLLLHRAAHLNACHGAVWNRLLHHKERSTIDRLGASVASPEEALAALAFPEIECLQLPYNILDTRWHEAHIPERLAERPEVLVFSRSAFLQGVLTLDADAWPVVSQPEAGQLVQWLDGWVKRCNRAGRADLCLAFVRGQTWIDSIIVGMETLEQLQENVHMFQTPPLDIETCLAIQTSMPSINSKLLMPSMWNN